MIWGGKRVGRWVDWGGGLGGREVSFLGWGVGRWMVWGGWRMGSLNPLL